MTVGPGSRRGRGWYRGDCHVHSIYSDGRLEPRQLVAGARAAGLDFVATTEHNMAAAHEVWSSLATDDLLVILGEEVTTETGHWLALGLEPEQVVEWRYRARDEVVDRHVCGVHEAGGLCVAAHPHAPYVSGQFMYPYREFDVVEVWNGPWTSDVPWQADNEAAVAEWGRGLAADIASGRWRPAMGNSDTHLDGQIGIPHTVVLADDLGVDAILAGLRAGRSWISGSASVELSVTACAGGRVAGIGECLVTGDEPVTVRVDVAGVPSGVVSFHTDQGIAQRETLPADGPASLEWRTTAERSSFVRVEVRHPGRTMAALTNPVVLV